MFLVFGVFGIVGFTSMVWFASKRLWLALRAKRSNGVNAIRDHAISVCSDMRYMHTMV